MTKIFSQKLKWYLPTYSNIVLQWESNNFNLTVIAITIKHYFFQCYTLLLKKPWKVTILIFQDVGNLFKQFHSVFLFRNHDISRSNFWSSSVSV